MSFTALRNSLLLALLPSLAVLVSADDAPVRMLPDPATATPVTENVNILDLLRNGEVEFNLNDKADPDFHDPAEEIFVLQDDGTLKVSGKSYGYMSTKKAYSDYHLVIEFKWSGPAWGKRADRARDNGLILHCHGPHGAYGGSWCAGVEAQIIEGGVGDILVLSPKKDGDHVYQTSVKANYVKDANNQMRWQKDAELQEATSGRINWEKRDIAWKDVLGFRGKDDVESPFGEWSKLEVIAKGDTLQYFVNGVLVNEAFDVKPSGGAIALQTEGAEMIVRRYELLPLEK